MSLLFLFGLVWSEDFCLLIVKLEIKEKSKMVVWRNERSEMVVLPKIIISSAKECEIDWGREGRLNPWKTCLLEEIIR